MLPKVNSATEHAMLVDYLRSSDTGLRATVARTLQQLGGSRTLFDLLCRAYALTQRERWIVLETGWQASIGLDAGIRSTYRWFLDRHETDKDLRGIEPARVVAASAD